MLRLPQLDFARGLAILLVIAVHAGQCVPQLAGAELTLINQGARGVQLFFVVSAYALMLVWDTRGDGALPFYVRRLFRIAPMFWLAIIVFTAMSGLTTRYYAPDGITWLHVAATAFFVNGFWPSAISSVVPGGWTIAVEMMFYLIFPLIVIVLRHWSLTAIALFLSIYFSGSIFNHSLELLQPIFTGQDRKLLPDMLWLWLPNQLPAFLTGMLVYQVGQRFGHLPNGLSLAGACVVLALLLSFAFWTPLTQVHLSYSLGFGAALYLMLGMKPDYFPSWMTNIGKLSYGAYLWHWLWLSLLTVFFGASYTVHLPAHALTAFAAVFVILTVLTLIGAAVTYVLVERPGIRLGSLLATRLKEAPASVATPA